MKPRTRKPAQPKVLSRIEGKNPKEDSGDGLRCKGCGCAHLPVLYTRPHPGNRIKRVRTCRHCGRRLTTYESTPSMN